MLALAAVYVADYVSLRFHIPAGRPVYGSVQVQTLYAVRQKNGRLEYSLGDTTNQTCVRSVFPQFGLAPCWYLVEHATRQIQIGRADFGGLNAAARSTIDWTHDRTSGSLGSGE